MIKLYWNPIFNKSWIYLSDELILENLTNEKSIYAIKNFYNQVMIPNYIENIDYKNITYDEFKNFHWLFLTNENIPLKPGNRKKFYLITGETYKCMLMSSKARKGKETRLYYIKIETLANTMKDYIYELLKIEITQANQKALKFQTLYNTNTQKHHFWKFLIKGACFYIIISGIDAADGIMRIKIGVAGCKSKGTKCTNCDFQKDSNTHNFS
jgi:phage anti-repressor protein